MNHENWDDQEIEKLLNNIPKINDQRSKDAVFNRLKNDGLFDEEPSYSINNKVKKSKNHWISIVVSFAALCLLVLFMPKLIQTINHTSESSFKAEDSTGMKQEGNSDSLEMFTEEIENELDDKSMSKMDVVDLRTAVYTEDLEEGRSFKLGLASDAADSIPITVIIPEEKIREIFGQREVTGIDLYNYFAPLFNEEAIGFIDYHPFVGKITEKGNHVIHELPKNQKYDVGSASFSTYIGALIDTFNDYYDGVTILNEDGNKFVFSEVGEPMEPLNLNNELTHYNYYKYTQSNVEYLAPNFRSTYSTVEDAIYAMKEEKNEIYESVILPNVEYKVSVEDETVFVIFEEPLDLLEYGQQDSMQMIEGILLTAASFNKNVQFQNIIQTDWQGFNFSEVLPKPIGANKIPYESVFN